MTEGNAQQLEFHGLGRRVVAGDFNGVMISSDGGALLLREVESRTHMMERLAEQFVDHRDPEAIKHMVKDSVGQGVFALALGYEDLNDHGRLRLAPMLAVLVGKEDLTTGKDRLWERDKGKALASSSTLDRLELAPPRCRRQGTLQRDRGRPRGYGPFALRLLPGLL